MTHPTNHMILFGAGRDPRHCRTEAELNDAVADTMRRAREYDGHIEKLRGGVPGILSELRRDITRAQLAQLRRRGDR